MNQKQQDYINNFINKEIVNLLLTDDNEFTISFKDGINLTLIDSNQQCCEHRYITCDDKLDEFIGSKFLGIDIKESTATVEETEDFDTHHDIEFVEIKTTKGSITLCTHNEHNGYYGGFNLEIKELISDSNCYSTKLHLLENKEVSDIRLKLDPYFNSLPPNSTIEFDEIVNNTKDDELSDYFNAITSTQTTNLGLKIKLGERKYKLNKTLYLSDKIKIIVNSNTILDFTEMKDDSPCLFFDNNTSPFQDPQLYPFVMLSGSNVSMYIENKIVLFGE